jgi:hypothetical protein
MMLSSVFDEVQYHGYQTRRTRIAKSRGGGIGSRLTQQMSQEINFETQDDIIDKSCKLAK